MIRNPLRPLTKILYAREIGLSVHKIESEERIKRLNSRMRTEGNRARRRILLLTFTFCFTFLLIGTKMLILASNPPNYLSQSYKKQGFGNPRINIVDRNGAVLATNVKTFSLYVHPHELIQKETVAASLAGIFPDINTKTLVKKFSDGRKFVWVKKKLSPEQHEEVKNLGEPGVYFGPRRVRFYPNGKFASHILGGTTFGREAVDGAELIGQAGVELYFNDFLSDPSNNKLTLSIDMTSQSIIEKVLGDGVKIMNAKGGSAILMDVQSGQIISMASLPDFDPNNRPKLKSSGDPADSPLFNRAAQGIYELGSTFKIFTVAHVLEESIVSEDTMVDIKGPIYFGKYQIKDHHYLGEELSVSDIIVKSSNIGTARLAALLGGKKQRDFLKKFGLLDLTGLELPEAARAKPQSPRKWSKISTATVSYGHGISVSPLHLASAYSAVVNGGKLVKPTIIKNSTKLTHQKQIISSKTSSKLKEMLSDVVKNGTAKNASIHQYTIGGKTGTAEKVNFDKPGYIEDKVITTFVACFPMEEPKYVLVVTLDEPEDWSIDKPMRTASWTAVPVAREIIKRVAPVLGLKPNNMPTSLELQNSLVNIHKKKRNSFGY